MKTFKLATNNAVLCYHDIPGSGVPLVFVHGLGCAGSSDYPQLVGESMLAGRRSILIDLLGYGFSDKPEDFSYSMEDHALCLIELLQGLDIRQCDLFGHSMGGAIAISLAAHAPSMVRSLMVAEPNLVPGGGVFSRAIAAYSESDYVKFGHEETIDRAIREGQEVWAGTMRVSSPVAVHRSAVSLVEGTQPSWRSQLQHMTMPRSVIVGDRSLPDPEFESLPEIGVALLLVANAGHSMMLDNPSGTAATILAATRI